MDCCLAHSYKQVELAVDRRELRILVEEELNLPEAGGVDLEGIRLRPVLTIGKGDVKRRPGGPVELDGLIESRRRVVDRPHSDEVHSDCVVDHRALVVHDTEEHAPSLVHGQVRRVAARVPTRAEEVELCEGFDWARGQHDVCESASGDDDAPGQSNREAFVKGPVLLPLRDPEVQSQGEPPVRWQPHAAHVSRVPHASREQSDGRDNGLETNCERREA